MSDKKSIAIALGTAVGIVTVAACVGLYVSRQNNAAHPKDVDDVLEQARHTVKKLNEAVDILRHSASA